MIALVENVDEHRSVPEQSDVSGGLMGSRSMSTRNRCGAPSPLARFIVIVSPWVAVIVGFEPEGWE